MFLRQDFSEKNELIKSVFQSYLNPALNLQKALANKDYQEIKAIIISHLIAIMKKLNNSRSEINCRDDVQINNRQKCNHVKLCQPESSNYPSKNNNGNESNFTNNSNDKEKEARHKTELKESSQK